MDQAAPLRFQNRSQEAIADENHLECAAGLLNLRESLEQKQMSFLFDQTGDEYEFVGVRHRLGLGMEKRVIDSAMHNVHIRPERQRRPAIDLAAAEMRNGYYEPGAFVLFLEGQCVGLIPFFRAMHGDAVGRSARGSCRRARRRPDWSRSGRK